MLSDRITTLFELLSCSNTDIARYADCSPSNISRLKSGSRMPAPDSRTITKLAEGIWQYADHENMQNVLCQLTNAGSTKKEQLIPALITWLYDTKKMNLPKTPPPESRQQKAYLRLNFGYRLDHVMKLLGLSNVQLASQLNIDASLVSRYRNGVHSPHGNPSIIKRLSEFIYVQAIQTQHDHELAQLCHLPENELSTESLAEWFFSAAAAPFTAAEQLMQSINALTLPAETSPALPPLPPVPKEARYWGTAGLRNAVIRLLSDAAHLGGELMLYSDEPMDWMSHDADYFALWKALMAACVRHGIKIRLIHNTDRGLMEMADAIKSWLPLYISGMIEPYVFRKMRNPRFCHTVFLHQGHACIHGFFPAAAGEDRWYDYITDELCLPSLMSGYRAMLSDAVPFLKTFPATQRETFYHFCDSHTAEIFLLSGLPIFTMPEALFTRMLSPAALSEPLQQELLARYRKQRHLFKEALKQRSIHILLHLKNSGENFLNLKAGLMDMVLPYTPSEYASHLTALKDLVEKEQNFHLTLLPDVPFQDIQIIGMKDAVAVLRCKEPYAAFVFMNPALTQSVSDYFASLTARYSMDRMSTSKALLDTPES